MSEHRHRRRRRTSGFDLARLYEDDHHVLEECLHEKRHVLAGWALVFAAGAFGLLLLVITLATNLWVDGAPLTFGDSRGANLPHAAASLSYPPDSASEELSNPGSNAVAVLLLFAAIFVAGLHLASGTNESGTEGAGEPGGFQAAQPAAAEPSAFRQRLDEMVCIKMSRRAQSRGHRHHF